MSTFQESGLTTSSWPFFLPLFCKVPSTKAFINRATGFSYCSTTKACSSFHLQSFKIPFHSTITGQEGVDLQIVFSSKAGNQATLFVWQRLCKICRTSQFEKLNWCIDEELLGKSHDDGFRDLGITLCYLISTYKSFLRQIASIIIIMKIFYYKNDKSIMKMSCYKGDKSIMISLIIIKISFVRF